MVEEEVQRFIEAFIVRDRKERWQTLLDSRKGRKRLVATFAHGYDFDSRWATHLGKTATVESVVALLKSKGAGDYCSVLSEDSSIDGATLPLEEAVSKVLRAGFGTYLIFEPSRLAFFESEEAGGHYLLYRQMGKGSSAVNAP